MTQEEKLLLLRELCTRLPYGVKIWYKYSEVSFPLYATSIRIAEEKIALSKYFNKEGDWFPIIEAGEILIKPYLRTISSMTEDEMFDFHENGGLLTHHFKWDIDLNILTVGAIDWLNKKGFDYRGLIPMGLAIEAKEGMYNTKQY